MNPSNTQPDYSTEENSPEILESTSLSALPPASSSTNELERQWQQLNQGVSRFLTEFPYYLSRFISQNQQAIINVILVLTILVTIKVILAVLGSLNDIPFLSTFLELVGLGYLLWFTNRYLLKAQSRQELLDRIQGIKRDISSSSNKILQTDIQS